MTRKTFQYRSFVGTVLGVQITNGDDPEVLRRRANGAPCHLVEAGAPEADYRAARAAAEADSAEAIRYEMDEAAADHAAEIYAEGAWLRYAERPDPDDAIERERETNDPGLIWLAAQREAQA